MYSIEFSKISKRFLKKLNKKEADILLNKIYSLRKNPLRNLKRLQGDKLWRLRMGDYRVIVDVIVLRNKVIVVRIGLRKNIY